MAPSMPNVPIIPKLLFKEGDDEHYGLCISAERLLRRYFLAQGMQPEKISERIQDEKATAEKLLDYIFAKGPVQRQFPSNLSLGQGETVKLHLEWRDSIYKDLEIMYTAMTALTLGVCSEHDILRECPADFYEMESFKAFCFSMQHGSRPKDSMDADCESLHSSNASIESVVLDSIEPH